MRCCAPGNAWSAMLRFAALAEQGCAVALENMGWLAQRVLPVPPVNPSTPEGGCLGPPSWWHDSNSGERADAVDKRDEEEQHNEEEQHDKKDTCAAGHGEGVCAGSDAPLDQPQGPVRRRKLPQSYRVPAFWTARGVEARWWQRVLAWRLRAADMELWEGLIDAGHMLCEGERLGLSGGAMHCVILESFCDCWGVREGVCVHQGHRPALNRQPSSLCCICLRFCGVASVEQNPCPPKPPFMALHHPSGSNVTRAAALFTTAAAHGSVEAMCALAWLHLHGVGTLPPNTTLAKAWFARAWSTAPSLSYAAPALLGLVLASMAEVGSGARRWVPGPWNLLEAACKWHVRVLGAWLQQRGTPGRRAVEAVRVAFEGWAQEWSVAWVRLKPWH